MKKIMSLMMILTMISNTAFASPVADSNVVNHTPMIAKTFNEFRYKMTVEVDPTSADFQANAVSEFKQRLADLQKKGVAPIEIMNYMRSSMLDDSSRKDFDRMMISMNENQISGEEAGNLAMQFMASKYQQGASYSGGASANYTWLAVVIGVVIVGVVAYMVIKNNPLKITTNTKTVTKTNTTTNTSTSTLTDTVTTTTTVTTTVTDTNTDCCYYNQEGVYCCGTPG